MLLVGFLVVGIGALELFLIHREVSAATATVQQSEARAAAVRIEQYLSGIRASVTDVAGLPWGLPAFQSGERRLEYQRLLKMAPAIAEIRHVGREPRDRLRVSRVDFDDASVRAEAGGAEDFMPRAGEEVAFGTPYFNEGSEPYVTLAVRDAGSTEARTLAELNLKFVTDLVRQIKLGQGGSIYVVDNADRLVAHPNLDLVLGKTDLSRYVALQRVRASLRSRDEVPALVDAEGLEGGPALLSGALIPSTDWLVVAEQPKAEVLAPVNDALWRTGLFVLGGLIAALLMSYFLAHALSIPILRVRHGAERIAGGDFSARLDVRTGDEVEDLAASFNRMAAQLQDYMTGLERKVAEKTAELASANRHKSEFLTNMSHELRTPLNAVIGFSDVLQEQMFGELNPKQMEYVRDINSSGQHLLSLINDILDLAKIEAGRMELDPRPFDVAAALDNCRTLIRERARGRGLRLSFGLPEKLGDWVGDERKFKQVVLNLLSNAVKFTPPGGEVGLLARRDPDALVVTVTDTGPGIAPEDHDAAFEEFRQLKNSGDAKREGTGLGLALTRRLVELHGGSIRLESAAGRGATFIVRFPESAPVGADV